MYRPEHEKIREDFYSMSCGILYDADYPFVVEMFSVEPYGVETVKNVRGVYLFFRRTEDIFQLDTVQLGDGLQVVQFKVVGDKRKGLLNLFQ